MGLGSLFMSSASISQPRSQVVMKAASDDAPVISGDNQVKGKENFQDMMFLSQRYDHYRDDPAF